MDGNTVLGVTICLAAVAVVVSGVTSARRRASTQPSRKLTSPVPRPSTYRNPATVTAASTSVGEIADLKRKYRRHRGFAIFFTLPLAYAVATMGPRAEVSVDAILWTAIVVGNAMAAAEVRRRLNGH